MERLSGREDMCDDRYGTVGFMMVSGEPETFGTVDPVYPPATSPLLLSRMFETIYRQYDLRFVYQAPDLGHLTRRRIWAEKSPAFQDPKLLDYEPRAGAAEDEAEEMDVESGESHQS